MNTNFTQLLGFCVIFAVVLGCSSSSTGDTEASLAPLIEPVMCQLTNPFSQEPECKQYTGNGWTMGAAKADCDKGQYNQPGNFEIGTCALPSILGTCRVNFEPEVSYTLALGGNNADFCSTTARACVNFVGGSFETAQLCADQYVDTPPVGSEPLVFEWPTQTCQPPLDGEAQGNGPDGHVCTWNLISGCTEEGRQFFEYGSCESVWTNRPYYPVPGRQVADESDPRMADDNYLEESNWVKSQVEACACICCHTERSPDGPAKWSTDAGPLWTDTMSDTAISLFAGYVDSSALGAFDPADNNGFDRINSALPTTDVPRMIAFFQREFERRGIEEDFANNIRPIGGPLVEQRHFVPDICEPGSGIQEDGTITWRDESGARYVYILEWNSANPGIPPNFDMPDGTKWRVDVASADEPLVAGSFRYGEIPTVAFQSFPKEGALPAPLTSGKYYYLYVLKDVGFVLERCLFEAP